MAKAIKLNRTEHISLRVMAGGSIGGIEQKMMEKFVLFGLVNAYTKPGQNTCTYTITRRGEEYLQQHPELPPYRMTEAGAQIITRLLKGASYDCAPPFDSDEGIFQNMIRDQAVVEVPNTTTNKRAGYLLTEEARSSFEETVIGSAYTERVKTKEKVEELTLQFDGTKDAKLEGAPRLRAKAKFFDKKGYPDAATELNDRAVRLESEEYIWGTFLSGYDSDSAKISLNSDNVLEQITLVMPQGMNDVRIGRKNTGRYQEGKLVNTFSGFQVFYYGDTYGDDNANVGNSETEYFANMLYAAIAIARRLNAEYHPEEK